MASTYSKSTPSRALIDGGATLVVGTHPHAVQGVVEHRRGLTAFSLGDPAFFGRSANGRTFHRNRITSRGLVLTTEIANRAVVSTDYLLTRHRPDRVTIEPSRRQMAALRRISSRVSAPGGYVRRWRRYILSRTIARVASKLLRWRWRTISRGTFAGFKVWMRETLGRRE